jgi:hypothetical protein
LERYRELAVLIYLRDELFQSILPRIKRRLSFAAPRELRSEDMPARGRIDWTRTINTSLNSLPGEPPLKVQTRQRRRHFSTPENVLVVATLLEYQAKVHTVLATEAALGRAQAFQHPLTSILDTCARELVFPQFASLVNEAIEIVEQHTTVSIEDLEHQAAANLLPGHNSAYNDLLVWRHKLSSLQLLDSPQDSSDEVMLGASADEVDYLYQIWLFYELIDIIQRRHRLIDWQPLQGSVTFCWGQGDQQSTYILRHDRAIRQHWRNAPGVRPDLYIAHVDRNEVRDRDTLIWHEPGFVLDAKYYKPRDSSRAPSSTVKRMIADLHLSGERNGALLFAFQRSNTTKEMRDTSIPDSTEYEPAVPLPDHSNAPLYRVTPEGPAAQRGAPDEMIAIWRVCPRLGSEADTEHALEALLKEVHTRLQSRLIPRCQGIFLDELSAVQQAGLTDRYGTRLDSSAELLICPKPHIGPWRADLVSRSRHCCRDARLCHIIGQPGARPPVRPARKPEELLQALEQIFASGQSDNLTDEQVSAIAQQVETLTRQFAHYNGLEKNLTLYDQRVQDLGLSNAIHLLAAPERESLAIGLFLVDQLDSISATDFSAPAIHLSSVMELEIQRRIFRGVTLIGVFAHPHNQTLGKLPWMRREKEQTEGNWERIVEHVAAHWNTHMDSDSPDLEITFDLFISKALARISQLRNQAAHTHPVTREQYRELQRLMFQGGALGYGALNALLLAWRYKESDRQ